jgi:hypothetical protein
MLLKINDTMYINLEEIVALSYKREGILCIYLKGSEEPFQIGKKDTQKFLIKNLEDLGFIHQ